MAFVYNKKVVVGEEVEKAIRSFTRLPTVEIS
jgi:hypothetical protein